MKNTISIILTILFCTFTQAQVIQKFYLDFGPNDKTNGNATVSPDVNGNYWNNITTSALTYNLYNSENKPSQFTFIVNSYLGFNGILNGGLLTPDINKLGDLAVPTATQDFMYSTTPARMTFRNLNIFNGYKFYFFGSRESNGTRTTNFAISGDNSCIGTLQTSGSNLGGQGINANNSTIFVTDTIRPDINGEIKIDMSPGTGGFAYLNAMKFEGINITDIKTMSIKGDNVYIPNDSTQITVSMTPSNASPKPIAWSIDDSTKASISPTGLLIAKQNGIVIVTATIIQNGTQMTASTQINITNQLSESNALQKLYFDFGPNDKTNGNITTNPSRKGIYWNNITATSIQYPLINSTNQNTGFKLTVNTSTALFNGIQNGGLLNPDSLMLGEMAVPSATQDYLYTTSTCQFKIGGLNKSRGYRFFLFGSRDLSSPRNSYYTITGLNNCAGSLQTSGMDIGGHEFNNNRNNFYISELVIPDKNGEVSVQINGSMSNPAYLNMMKMEEFEVVSPSQISIINNNVIEPYSTPKMGISFLPSNATPLNVRWSVNDTTVATISPKGVIYAKQNGTITVSAYSMLANGQILSDSKEITISNQISDLYVDGDALVKDNYQIAQDGPILMRKAFGSSDVLKGVYELNTVLKPTGGLLFFASKAENNTTIIGQSDSKGLLCMNGKKISPAIQGEVYIRVNLIKKTYEIIPVDTTKITLIGSSVAYGGGATNLHGWFYQLGLWLNQRYLSNAGGIWNTSNVSIAGNNTYNALDRWDTDLLDEGSRYVIIGLSLGNEGIAVGGQVILNQFRNNLSILINKTKAEGKIPILTNCYGRNDYTLSEYKYTKQMNLLIHQMDVPSINMLGALDNFAGGCPTKYMADALHPNDLGHTELFYSIVPTLFDAIRNKKKSPKKVNNTYLTMGSKYTSEQLAFTPDNIIHSFTTSFDIRTTSTGIICTFNQSDSLGVLKINESGTISYVSPNGSSVTCSNIVNDGQWHKITLSHYYAKGATVLYADTVASVSLNERILAHTFVVNNDKAPELIDYKNWMFYRAGMNPDEIAELNNGKLLQSSLELYAPLDGLSTLSADTLINLAQSMNKLKRIDTLTQIHDLCTKPVKIFPNPVTSKLRVSNIDIQDNFVYRLYNVAGQMLINNTPLKKDEIDVENLSKNRYVLLLINTNSKKTTRFEFIKR